jgi:hypothetical protein
MNFDLEKTFDPSLVDYDPTKEYNPNGQRIFNQFTRTHYDLCQYENQMRLESKPMKYFVNDFNTPQVDPFYTFTVIGNQKQFNVQNEYDRPLPTRLNPIYQSYVLPYSTTPFLGASNPSREYNTTESNLRFGDNFRAKKSSVALGEVDYNRWQPGVDAMTVQNAGQFSNGKIQGLGSLERENELNYDPVLLEQTNKDGYFDHDSQNNVLFANSSWPYFGISSRNQLHNAVTINNC